MSHLERALAVAKAGFGVLPLQPDKRPEGRALADAGFPEGKWKELQSRIATETEIKSLFANGAEFGLICGAVSGNLECLDFDVPGKHDFKPGEKGKSPLYHPFVSLIKEHGEAKLLKSLVIVETASGGKHILYRCISKVAGSQKVAYDRSVSSEALIETKGEGGYIATWPTPGYKVLQGDLLSIPEIDADQRDFLLSCAFHLSKDPIDDSQAVRTYSPAQQRPGDLYEAATDWASILAPIGWKHVKRVESRDYWVRPGKEANKGISGTTGNITASGRDCFYCHTSSAPPFQPGKLYSKFAAYALLNFNGDYIMAAQELGRTQRKSAQAESVSVGLKLLSEFNEETTDWFMPPYIPLGALTLIQGDPGVGKSRATRALIATLTSGGKLPTGQKCDPAHVILLSCEDSPSRVLVREFRELGADPTKISLVDVDEGGDVPASAAIENLEDNIRETGARLVVIDPVVEYIGSQVEMNQSNQVRAFLKNLRGIAARTNIAILLVHHLNKATGQKAIYRSVGSIDFIAACRSALMVGQDPDESSVRSIDHIKTNLAAYGKPLGFAIDETGLFRWTGESNLTADRMMEQRQVREVSPTLRQSCQEWLTELLAVGIPVPSDQIFKDGKDCGYSQATIWRAKRNMPEIKTRKRGEAWEWFVVDLSNVYRGGD